MAQVYLIQCNKTLQVKSIQSKDISQAELIPFNDIVLFVPF